MALVELECLLHQPPNLSTPAPSIATADSNEALVASVLSDYWTNPTMEGESMTVEAVAASPDESVGGDSAVIMDELSRESHDSKVEVTGAEPAQLLAWARYHHCASRIGSLERLAKSFIASEKQHQQHQQQSLSSTGGRVPLAQRAESAQPTPSVTPSDCASTVADCTSTTSSGGGSNKRKRKKKRHSWCVNQKYRQQRQRQLRPTPPDGDDCQPNRRIRVRSSQQSGSCGSSVLLQQLPWTPSASMSASMAALKRAEISTPSWRIAEPIVESASVEESADTEEDLSNAAYARRHRKLENAERRCILLAASAPACGRNRGSSSSSSSHSAASAASPASSSSASLAPAFNAGYSARQFPLDEDPS